MQNSESLQTSSNTLSPLEQAISVLTASRACSSSQQNAENENMIANLLAMHMRKLIISRPHHNSSNSGYDTSTSTSVPSSCSTNALISRLRYVSDDMRIIPPLALVATEPAVSQLQADAGAMLSQLNNNYNSSPLGERLAINSSSFDGSGQISNMSGVSSSPLTRGYHHGGGGGGGYNSDTSVGSHHSSPGRGGGGNNNHRRKKSLAVLSGPVPSFSRGGAAVTSKLSSSLSANPLELRVITSTGSGSGTATPSNFSRGCTPVTLSSENDYAVSGNVGGRGAGGGGSPATCEQSTPTGQSTNYIAQSTPKQLLEVSLTTGTLSVSPPPPPPPPQMPTSSTTTTSASSMSGGGGEGRAFYRVNNSGVGGEGGGGGGGGGGRRRSAWVRQTSASNQFNNSGSTLSSSSLFYGFPPPSTAALSSQSHITPHPSSSVPVSRTSSPFSASSASATAAATSSTTTIAQQQQQQQQQQPSTVSPLLLRVRRLSESYTSSPETLPAAAINAIRRARALARSPSGGFLHNGVGSSGSNGGVGGVSSSHTSSPMMNTTPPGSGHVSLAAPSPETVIVPASFSSTERIPPPAASASLATTSSVTDTASISIPISSSSSPTSSSSSSVAIPSLRRLQSSVLSSSLMDWGVGRKSNRQRLSEGTTHPLLMLPVSTRNRLETPRGYSQLHGEGMGYNRLLPSTLHTSSSLRRGGGTVDKRKVRALSASAVVDELHSRHMERNSDNSSLRSSSSNINIDDNKSSNFASSTTTTLSSQGEFVQSLDHGNINAGLQRRPTRRQGSSSLGGSDLLKLRSSAWATASTQASLDVVNSTQQGDLPSKSGGKLGRRGVLTLESSGPSSSAVSSEDEEGVAVSRTRISSSTLSLHSPSVSPSSASTMLTIRAERKHSSLSGKPLSSNSHPKPSLSSPTVLPMATSTLVGTVGNSSIGSSAGGSGDRSSPSSTLSVYAVNRIRAESEAEKEDTKDMAFALDSDISQQLHLHQRLKIRDPTSAARASLSLGSIGTNGGTCDHNVATSIVRSTTTTTTTTLTLSSTMVPPPPYSLTHLRHQQQRSSSLSDAMFGVSLPLSPVTPPPSQPLQPLSVYTPPSSTGRRTPIPSPLRKATMGGSSTSSPFSSTTVSVTNTTTSSSSSSSSIINSSSQSAVLLSPDEATQLSSSSLLPDTSVLESALLAGLPATIAVVAATTTAAAATTTKVEETAASSTLTGSATLNTAEAEEDEGVLTWSVGLTLLTHLCPTFHTTDEKDAFMHTGKALWLQLSDGSGDSGDCLTLRKVSEFSTEIAKLLTKK